MAKCSNCQTDINSGSLCGDCSSSTNDIVKDVKSSKDFGKGKKN